MDLNIEQTRSIVDWHFQSLEQGFQKNPKVENFIRRIEFTD